MPTFPLLDDRAAMPKEKILVIMDSLMWNGRFYSVNPPNVATDKMKRLNNPMFESSLVNSGRRGSLREALSSATGDIGMSRVVYRSIVDFEGFLRT